jgi:hypothetical protein
MPFRSGSIGYARFRVVSAGSASAPTDATHELLQLLSQHTLRPSEIGEPPPVEFGWCGGRHVFDEEFAAEHNVFGRTLLFGLRIDTNKVPAEIRRAYRAIAETGLATDTPTGFLSRRERQAARDEALERCRQDLASGKHRRSKMVEILWDLERGVLLAPVFSDVNVAGLRDLFFATFDLRLEPVTAGSLAHHILAGRGQSRAYQDMQPSRFTGPPAGFRDDDSPHATSSDRPPVAWAHGATSEANDFVGNEFLLWLWRRGDGAAGRETDAAERAFDIACILDRTLELECAWEVLGKVSLQNGVMTRAPEALRALQVGKWPRKAGLTIALSDESWQATLQGDRFNLSGLRVPPPRENPKSQRELVEHRLDALQRFDAAMVGLFEAFLSIRAEREWTAESRRISDWITGKRGAHRQAETREVKLVEAAEAVESAV